MTLPIKILVISALCLLGVFVTTYYFFNPVSESNPIHMDDIVISKLCEESKHPITVTVYTNSASEVGGYFTELYIQKPDDIVPGWSGTLYDATGKVLAEGDSLPPFSESAKRDQMRSEIHANFPIETKVNCSK